MPIYEYACSACGAECEMLQKVTDAPAKRCPTCGKDALTKEVSAAGFRLKGSGWYETDFKSSHRQNVVDSAPSGKEAPSGEAKPAKTAETAKPATPKSAGAASKNSGSVTAGA